MPPFKHCQQNWQSQTLNETIIKELEETNNRFAQAVQDKDYFTALKIDEDFHQIIVDHAANSYIHTIVASLQTHVRRLFFHNSIIMTEKSIDEHAKIIKCLKEGKKEEVAAVMRENWIRAIDEFNSMRTN